MQQFRKAFSNRSLRLAFTVILVIIIVSCRDDKKETEDNGTQFPAAGKFEGDYWPTQEWRRCAPEEVGMNSDNLMKAYEYAANPQLNTHGIAVIRKGYIVGEAYFGDYTVNTHHDGFSMAKSFTSALIGIAIGDGKIAGIDEKVYPYFPQWNYTSTPEIKKRLSIRHLLTMTGGLDWNRDSLVVDDLVMANYEDYLAYVLSRDILYEPGTKWYYSNGEAILLSGILEKVYGRNAYSLAYLRIFDPIGATGIYWLRDLAGHTNTAYGIHATARDFAKFGYLYLKKGSWDGQQIIPQNWIEESTKAVSDSINFYGYLWWLPPGFEDYQKWDIPAGTFIALGAYTQRLFVVPAKDLVVVRLGNDPELSTTGFSSMEFLSLIINSVN